MSNRIDMPQYTVEADPETGQWIGEPEYVGDVNFGEWCAKPDTWDHHYDTYTHRWVDIEGDEHEEERAIDVEWLFDNEADADAARGAWDAIS